MATEYSKTSPYYKTNINADFMDVWNPRTLPRLPDDVAFRINATYRYRPDLLAHDLYGDASYWWVFAVRNPDVIKDPIFDFVPGVRIYLPKKETITSTLG